MYCKACGKTIPDQSFYCNFCGTAQASPPAGAQAGRNDHVSATEQVIFTVRPTLLFICLGYGATVILSLAAAAVIAHFKLPLSAALGVAAILILLPISSHVRRQSETYTLTTHRIEITSGLMSKTTRNIPLNRIQDVTVTRSLGERLIGIGDIEIDSAAETGKCYLRNVSHPARHVEIIWEQMRNSRP